MTAFAEISLLAAKDSRKKYLNTPITSFGSTNRNIILLPKYWYMPIEKLDVLIHPFYDPIKAGEIDALKNNPAPWAKRAVNFYTRPEHISEQEALNKRKLEVWKKRIDDIAPNKNHFLSINAVEELPSKFLDELVNYARIRMGEHRVILHKSALGGNDSEIYRDMASKIAEKSFDKKKIKLNFFGEFGGGCVVEGVEHLSPHLIPSSRAVQAIKVSLPLSVNLDQTFYDRSRLKEYDDPDYIMTKFKVWEKKKLVGGADPYDLSQMSYALRGLLSELRKKRKKD